MAMATDVFGDDEKHTVLGKVLSAASRTDPNSLYVRVFKIGKDRRTDGGAKDYNTMSVDFVGGIEQHERNDYVKLTFMPLKYSDSHALTSVKSASFSEPPSEGETAFPNTDIPVTCPQCGREAVAIVKTEYDSTTGGKVAADGDMCAVDPDNRGKWFGLSGEHTWVHGTE